MSGFLWPWALALLALVPLLVVVYRRGRRPPAETVALHPDLALIARATPGRRRWRSHLPALLYLLAFAVALVAFARPTFLVPEANPAAGVILAIDVSRSMRATDINPTRFDAAREALRAFVRELPAHARVGLVVFSGYARTVVPLTPDHQRILDAVNLLSLGSSTAIGEAILESLRDLPTVEERSKTGDDPSRLATVILLSDGRNRTGADPFEAARKARDDEVTIHTVGVGTNDGGTVPGVGDRFGFASRFDETALRAIADETGGQYVFVDSAASLDDVYRKLSKAVAVSFHRDEASALVAFVAAIVLALSMLSSAYRRRVA